MRVSSQHRRLTLQTKITNTSVRVGRREQFEVIIHNTQFKTSLHNYLQYLFSTYITLDKGSSEDVPLAELMHLVFTRLPGENYSRRLGSLLLCLCDVFLALIHSLVY